jgi:hypothetical protein
LVLAFTPDRAPNTPFWGVSSPIYGRYQLNADFFNTYDWYKHLTTVSTGSVLLITAVTKALFPHPRVAWLLVVALAGFLLSALVSVLAMAGSADAATATPAPDESGRGRWQKWLWRKFRSQGVQDWLLYSVVLTFGAGMISFTVFAACNAI